MKKTVISILLILPFVLLVIISIAGRIYGEKPFVKVESISIVQENGEIFETNEIKIQKNKRFQLHVLILPENATDKTVTYRSSKPEVCSVTNDGVLTGLINNDSCIIYVKSNNGNKETSIVVSVYDSGVESITLDKSNITLAIGATGHLNATVLPYTAENKDVVWTSSNTEVCKVNSQGELKALSVGTAIITATTLDGGFSDTCEVSVVEGQLVEFKSSYFQINSQNIDLFDYINYNGVEPSKINFEIITGANVSLEGSLLKFEPLSETYIVSIKVFADGDAGFDKASFIYTP